MTFSSIKNPPLIVLVSAYDAGGNCEQKLMTQQQAEAWLRVYDIDRVPEIRAGLAWKVPNRNPAFFVRSVKAGDVWYIGRRGEGKFYRFAEDLEPIEIPKREIRHGENIHAGRVGYFGNRAIPRKTGKWAHREEGAAA